MGFCRKCPSVRLALLLLTLTLLLPGAAATPTEEPEFQPLTMYPQYTSILGRITRDPTPDPWVWTDDSVCLDEDEVQFSISSGRPVLENGELIVEGTLGMDGRIQIAAASTLSWVVQVPTLLPVPSVIVTASVELVQGEILLQGQHEATLAPDAPTYEATNGAFDIHRIDIHLQGEGDYTQLERSTLVNVRIESPACLARHHSSPDHRPQWDLEAGSPLQARSPVYDGETFAAWVGSAWGPDDLRIGDLQVKWQSAQANYTLSQIDGEAICHCENDSYQFWVTWAGPDPGDAWSATAEVGSHAHTGTRTLFAAHGAISPTQTTPAGSTGTTLLLLGVLVMAASWRRH